MNVLLLLLFQNHNLVKKLTRKKCFCCINLIKLQSNYHHEKDYFFTIPLLLQLHLLLQLQLQLQPRKYCRWKIIALSHDLVHLQIDITFWYTYIIYIDVNAFLLLLLLLLQLQHQFHQVIKISRNNFFHDTVLIKLQKNCLQ